MDTQEPTTEILPAGTHRVAVVHQPWSGAYRREPCSGCPWRKDQTGKFPPEAFRHSANTAEEGATHTFGCHESGIKKTAMCAGFILRGGDHNEGLRSKVDAGGVNPAEVTDGGHQLHDSYRAMAEANGVAPDDPALAYTRPPLKS